MLNLNINKIKFEEQLDRGLVGTVYPYQEDNNSWVVKHIVTSKYKNLSHHFDQIVLGFNCDHPNVLPITGYLVDFDEKQKIWNIYLKLPRMTDSLRKVIDKHRAGPWQQVIPEEVVVRHFYALTRSLQYLHGKGIAHGGIKPNNILLDENDVLKVTDFGMGNLANGEPSYLVDKAGFLFYGAPENKDANAEIDLFKADYWSLGMVMLELCVLDLKDLRGIQNQADVIGKVHELREKCKGRYKDELFNLILSLLQWEPSKRRDLKSIQEVLETNYPRIIEKEKDNKQILAERETEIKELKETVNKMEEKLARMTENKPYKKVLGTIKSYFTEEVFFSLLIIVALALLINALMPLFSDNGVQCIKMDVNGKIEGICIWPDGDRYEGEIRDGRMNGNGTYIFADGRKYVGAWMNDKKNGLGTFTWPDANGTENVYKGGFYNDAFHGKGILEMADGRKYAGDWRNNKKEGEGIFAWPEGAFYKGEYHNDVYHGNGTFRHPDGRKYVGEFKYGKMEGQGVLTRQNGDRYEGGFHDDLPHGNVTYIYSNGSSFVGEWKNGVKEEDGTKVQEISYDAE